MIAVAQSYYIEWREVLPVVNALLGDPVADVVP